MHIACYLAKKDDSDAYSAFQILHDDQTTVQQHFLNKSNQLLTLELYHLNESMLPFITCEPVWQKLKINDLTCLPLVLIDNIIVKEGALLTIKELENLLDIILTHPDTTIKDTTGTSCPNLNNALLQKVFRETRRLSATISLDDGHQLIKLKDNHHSHLPLIFPFELLKSVHVINEHDNPNWQIATLTIVDDKVSVSDIDWEGIEKTTVTRMGINICLKNKPHTPYDLYLPLINKDISADSLIYRENLALSIEITNILSALIPPIAD